MRWNQRQGRAWYESDDGRWLIYWVHDGVVNSPRKGRFPSGHGRFPPSDSPRDTKLHSPDSPRFPSIPLGTRADSPDSPSFPDRFPRFPPIPLGTPRSIPLDSPDSPRFPSGHRTRFPSIPPIPPDSPRDTRLDSPSIPPFLSGHQDRFPFRSPILLQLVVDLSLCVIKVRKYSHMFPSYSYSVGEFLWKGMTLSPTDIRQSLFTEC